jgi:hypothetical protein
MGHAPGHHHHHTTTTTRMYAAVARQPVQPQRAAALRSPLRRVHVGAAAAEEQATAQRLEVRAWPATAVPSLPPAPKLPRGAPHALCRLQARARSSA